VVRAKFSVDKIYFQNFHKMLKMQAVKVGGGACLKNLMYVGSSPSSQMPGSLRTCVISMMEAMETGRPALMELLVASKSPHKAWFDKGNTSSLSSLRKLSKISTNNRFRSLSVRAWCIFE